MPRDTRRIAARILLVDLATADRQIYSDYLQARGHRIFTADDGWFALVQVPYVDVVVTGIRLEGEIDGIEVVRQLRSDPATRALPVIVFTACGFEPDQMRAMSAGCDKFLAKPCLPETLAAAIEQAIAGLRRRHSTSSTGPPSAEKPPLPRQSRGRNRTRKVP